MHCSTDLNHWAALSAGGTDYSDDRDVLIFKGTGRSIFVAIVGRRHVPWLFEVVFCLLIIRGNPNLEHGKKEKSI